MRDTKFILPAVAVAEQAGSDDFQVPAAVAQVAAAKPGVAQLHQ
jgi:hypothetical protein